MRRTIAVAPFLFMFAVMAFGTLAIAYNLYLLAKLGLGYLLACPSH